MAPVKIKRAPLRVRTAALEYFHDAAQYPAGDMRRFVSEDAYIRTGIAITTPVSYQGAQIGPRGGLAGHADDLAPKDSRASHAEH